METKPSPIGVVHGPFSATSSREIASRVSRGSTSWPRSSAARPARHSTQSIGAPTASRMRRTAAVTSGPMPSQGMSKA